MARRTISTTVQLSSDDAERLRLLAARTQRTVDDYLQEAIALVLERHRAHLPEQLAWPAVAAADPAGPPATAHDAALPSAGPLSTSPADR